jgi:hypothetical protein
MYVENILREIKDIIHEAKMAAARAYDCRRDADRVFTNVVEGEEGSLKSYEVVSDGLVEASEALDCANDDLLNIEEMLKTLIYNVEMEALSAKVQSK